MKKVLIAFALMIAVSVSFAQNNASTTPTRVRPVPGKTQAEKQQEMEALITKLTLTKEQEVKFRAIEATYTKDKNALEPLKTSDANAYRAKMKVLNENNLKEVNAILTPAQQKTLAEAVSSREKKN